MKKESKAKLSQAVVNRFIRQMLKVEKQYKAKVEEFKKKGKDTDLVPEPSYDVAKVYQDVLIPMLFKLQGLDRLTERLKKQFSAEDVNDCQEAFRSELIKQFGSKNAEAFVDLFVFTGANVGDFEGLLEEEDDE